MITREVDEMYNAIDVANYIVNKSIDLGSPVSNLKLQKLLYYVQAAKMVEDNSLDGMFTDKICAWKYGPVVESVYHNFKIYANMPIKGKIKVRGVDLLEDLLAEEEYDPSSIIKLEDQTKINEVIEAYLTVNAMDLVRKTHAEDPWKDAYQAKQAHIENEAIKNYYQAHEEKLYS